VPLLCVQARTRSWVRIKPALTITQALLDGVSTLEVSRIVGTSLVMIEKHYGHLVQETARDRLARVQLL